MEVDGENVLLFGLKKFESDAEIETGEFKSAALLYTE